MLIVGLAFGIGLGIEAVPAFLTHFPPLVGNLFGSAATSGGLVAIILNLIMPEEKHDAVVSNRSHDERARTL
ncbi:Xanthine permease XanP [Serratia rubidaea]|nr:Xanthine permease XanP [Serratia rubidaea]